jgi:FkbM family methyltransferase
MENQWLEPVVDAYREYFDLENPIIIDIGTRDGDDAEFLRDRLNGYAGDVYAIDANPKAAWTTRYNHPGFNVIKTAIGDYEGVTDFLVIEGDKNAEGTSSMDTNKANEEWAAGKTHTIVMPITTMETLLYDYNILDSTLHVVKVDVESYTWEVLQGFGEALDNVLVFHLETEREYPGRALHTNNLEVASFMRYHGFFLVDVSYEWGDNIQDQVWINLRRAKHKPKVAETSEA